MPPKPYFAPIYFFAFDRPERARLFVQKLAHELTDLAIFIEDVHVIVIDGHETKSQRGEINRLSRESQDAWLAIMPPKQ